MVLTLIIIFSITAAFLNAWSSVLQRYEAGQREMEELFRGDFMKSLSKNPKWIGAFGLQILAFLFQAAALKEGPLILVQPLMTIDLVFLMLILHLSKHHMPVGKREWLSIAMICLGLSGTIFFANPKAGQKQYVLPHLMLVSTLIIVVMAVGIYVVRRTPSSSYRAAISGVAAGLSFSLVDVFTKIVTRLISHGFLYVLGSWQLWALFVAGMISIIMTQNTYGAGPVAISQPSMELVEPVIGIVLGIYLFGDMVNLSAANLFFAVVTAVIAGVGIVTLSRSKRLQSQEI